MSEKLYDIIQQIESLDYFKVSIADLQNLVNPILDGMTIKVLRLKPEQYIYRISVCPKPVNISRLTYPPREFTQLGRANDKESPLFYGSIGKNVPFFEVDAKKGDRLTLSVWKTKKDLILNHIGYTVDTSLSLGSVRNLTPSMFFTKNENEENQKDYIIYKFLSNLFTEKVNDHEKEKYKLTVAISNLFLASEDFDGLLYPTIKMRGNSDNVALKPKYVDENMELVSVEYLEITNVQEDKYSIKTLDTSKMWNKDGTIQWSGRHLGWKLQKGETFTSKYTGNDWVAKGVNDQRVDPVLTTPIETNVTAMEELYNSSFPMTIKIGERPPIKELDVDINFNIVLDLGQKRRWLSFYVPVCMNAYQVCLSLIASYDNFILLDLKNSITITSSDPVNVTTISTADFEGTKSIHFYSELLIDIDLLKKEMPSEYDIIFHN